MEDKAKKEAEIKVEKQQSVVLKDENEMDFRTKEAYKTLRANLEFAGDDVKVIAVTSCTPNEGKSSISMNLAKAIAEITPVGLNPNKQMVANFVKKKQFFVLTQLYRLKNRI